MTKAELRERRRTLRARLKAQRREARERLDANPTVRRARQARRRRRLLTVMMILLAILLISRCDCSEPAPLPPVVEPAARVPVQVLPPKLVPKPRPRVTTRIKQDATTITRPAFDGENHPPPSWIDAFRLQVAARSPRLSTCFDGSEKPGALRWTASVNGGSGAVSDQVLEPIGAAGGLSDKQRDCLVEVLTKPVYRLGGTNQPLPERVSIAIEF